jgi:hypothetical protein
VSLARWLAAYESAARLDTLPMALANWREADLAELQMPLAEINAVQSCSVREAWDEYRLVRGLAVVGCCCC